MPVDASSLIPRALDQLRKHPEVVSDEVPRLLERLAEVPDPRDPRGVRHALVAVLALTACAVLAGATSVLAVSLYARTWTSEDQRRKGLAIWNIHYNYHRLHSGAASQPPATRLRRGVTNVLASYS